MKVDSASFILSALDPDQYPRDRRPEFAFVGRSNVGKSSLMNALLHRKELARTSSTPGKTQTINFFDINERFYFVDLPGYGYAKVPKSLKDQWNKVMVAYLKDRDPLRMAAALVDARHTPTAQDHHMLQILEEAEVPTLIVATKVDKLKRSQRDKQLAAIRRDLDLRDPGMLVPFSSVSREGVKELWQVIEDLL